MNLATTIELYAGGEGSGCQGPNCGRPKTRIPVQLFHGTTLTNALSIVEHGFKANEEGYVYFMGNGEAAEAYGSMHDQPYAILYFNTPKDMPLEKDTDPEVLTGPSSFQHKGDFKPKDISVEVYSKDGEPIDNWHSRQSKEDLAAIVKQARE